MAVIQLNASDAAARDALLESLAISRGGQGVRFATIVVASLPAIILLGAPGLLVWLAALLLWDGVGVGQLKRHWIMPALERGDIRGARLRRASMVLFGLSLTQALPLTAWSVGGAFGTAVAAAWLLCAAIQVFVYYTHDRLSLVLGIAPVILCALVGPSLNAGLSWESAAISLFMLFGIGAGAAFVGRSDALIAQAAEQAAARKSAEASSFAKSRFIANMHHELRTPLNAIIGYTEMMREAAEEDGRRADIADLDRVLAAAHLQLTMMNDLLAFAELQDGRSQLEITEFDASLLLRETAEALRAGIETNGNTLIMAFGSNLAAIRSDAKKVRHCVEHLLSNAGKFTRDGQVVLRAACEREPSGDWLVISVQDNGAGIPPNRIKAIFEPFTQLDESMTRTADGAGVGLAISARTARLFGGNVSVESAPGCGSTFTLRVRADLAFQNADVAVDTAA